MRQIQIYTVYLLYIFCTCGGCHSNCNGLDCVISSGSGTSGGTGTSDKSSNGGGGSSSGGINDGSSGDGNSNSNIVI